VGAGRARHISQPGRSQPELRGRCILRPGGKCPLGKGDPGCWELALLCSPAPRAWSELINMPKSEPDLVSAGQRTGTPPARPAGWETLTSKFIVILETICPISGVSQPRVPADRLDGGPQAHVWFQEHFQEVLALRGDPQVLRHGDAFLLVVQHPGDVSVVEGQAGAEQDVEDDTHAPDVALPAVVGCAPQHLGRSVGRAAAGGPAQLPAVPGEQLGEAKIRQLQGAALQQGVLALEVAVGHPAAVAVPDGLDQLLEERPGLGFGQGTLAEHEVEDVPVLRQLHHEADLPLGGFQYLVHADDVPVVQA